MAWPAILVKAGTTVMGFLQPISDILSQWKEYILLWIAYRRGTKAGRKDARTESVEEELKDVVKVKDNRNDPDMRKRMRDKYSRDRDTSEE